MKCCKCGKTKDINYLVQDRYYCYDCYKKYTNMYLGGEEAYESNKIS